MSINLEKQQTKSKQRVFDHGEVFTGDREINSMLNLVKQETERIDSRFLDRIMPTVSRFGGGNRTKKKQTIIDMLKAFFEKYFGVGRSAKFTN